MLLSPQYKALSVQGIWMNFSLVSSNYSETANLGWGIRGFP
jgi:hypothetical protein